MTDTTATKIIDPFDAHVGGRIRVQRRMLGLNQTQLAKSLGVTFQQLQKYENATNRVSASMLQRAAQALGVSFGWFAEGYGEDHPLTPVDGAFLRVAVAARHCTPVELDATVAMLRTLTHGRTEASAHG
jgi:transcriptional regulator with XRE-family HTH domain